MLTCWILGRALHELVQLQQLHKLGVGALVSLQLLHQRRLGQHALQLRRHILPLGLGRLQRPPLFGRLSSIHVYARPCCQPCWHSCGHLACPENFLET